MRMLHIVQGDVDGDRKFLEWASQKNRDAQRWTVPKFAQIGDDVVVYVSGFGFFATARIKSDPKLRKDWEKRYGAGLSKIKLISPSISLFIIRRNLPELTWANYPRSITTPSSDVAVKVRRLIDERRKSRLLDLDSEALEEANIDELRRIALLKARSAATTKMRLTIHRARSRAIARYVTLRAMGHCEACEEAAPFLKPDGSPYLEPHHTTKLSDGGPDHPARVIALCPNCHRKAHHANNADAFNRSLIRRLSVIEPVK